MCVSLSVYVCFKLPLPSACGQSRRRLCTARTTLCVEPSFFLSSVVIPRAAKVTAENTYTKSTFVQTSFLWPLVVASQKKSSPIPHRRNIYLSESKISKVDRICPGLLISLSVPLEPVPSWRVKQSNVKRDRCLRKLSVLP